MFRFMAFPSRATRVSAVLVLLAGALVTSTVAADENATLEVGAPDILVYPGACRDIDAMDADAWGDAVGLIVRIDGEDQLISPASEVNQTQDGPGMSNDTAEFQEVGIDGVVTAKILTSRVDLKVVRDPLESQAWSQATVVDLNILDGTITADTVKAFAYAQADIHGAETMTNPSTIQNLKVPDLSITDVAPGSLVKLPSAPFGAGSFIATYVREDDSRFPGNGSILYEGDTTVTMVHVWLATVPGVGSLEVIVSQAHAHAESPTPFCGLVQSVAAGAYVMRARPTTFDDEAGILVGRQDIGVVGGSGRQQLLGEEFLVGPNSLLELNVSETRVNGTVTPNVESESQAISKVLGLCINQDGEMQDTSDPNFAEDYGGCFISATAIRAESNSRANATAAISWGSVTIVGLRVAGVDVCADLLGMPDDGNKSSDDPTATNPNICKPAKNTNYNLGAINITFNQRERDEARPGHTGYYVRAVRIESPAFGTIILGRAYSSADYFDPTA